MKFCLKVHNTEAMKEANEKTFEIPFDSKKKWQLSIHETNNKDGHKVLVIKGAPEIVLKKCKHYSLKGYKELIDIKFEN